MRNMKESGHPWLGKIPANWDVVYPKMLFAQRKDRAQQTDRQLTASQQHGVVYQDEYMELTGARVVVVEKDFDILKHVEKGDFVISMRSFQGGIEYSDNTGCISSAYVMLIPKKEYVHNRYFKWLLKSSTYISALQSTSNLVRDGQAMRYANFIQVWLPLIPITEQVAIAKILDKKCLEVDTLVANVHAQIEKLKAYKQSLITEIVTRGLDQTVPVKESGVDWIESIPQTWQISPLKTLFSFGKGLSITKENLTETGIPVISYGQIHAKWNTGVTTHAELFRFVSKEYLDSNPDSLVHKGDMIMADTSEDKEGCGNCAYIDTDDTVFAGYHTIILKSLSKTNTKYLAYLFLTDHWRSQLRKQVSGVKLFSVSKRILGSTTVLIPDCAEEIVAYLDDKCSQIDALIQIKQAKIEKLEKYKKSIIYEYVTGKKRVA